MTEDDVRREAGVVCDALVAGDIDAVIATFSDELKRNVGEVLALLPMPTSEAAIESLERGGSSHVVVLNLVGETDEVQLETRWKDRDGEPRIVEVSHLSQKAREVVPGEGETEGGAEDGGGTPDASDAA
jgi:hypothetical protein